jgi:hypothetical protein
MHGKIASNLPADASDQQFMSIWGDYLAEAGLADGKSPAPPAHP